MSIALQKLLKRLHNDDPDANDGGEGAGGSGGGDEAALRREQELEASRHGWVPKNKFKGPQEQWKDAATFLKDGQNFKGALQGEVARLKRELEEFKGTAKQFAEFQQRQIEQRDAEIADLMKDLKRQQREAIRDGDDATADAIDDRIELLQEERGNVRKQLKNTKQDDPESGAAGAGKVDPSQGIDENGYTTNPVILGFINDGNEWLRDNKAMRDYSFSIANDLIQQGETRRGAAFLAIIREKMEEAFPRYFGEGRTDPGSRGSLSEGGGSSRGGSGGHTENDLPPEDRALMELGIRQKWTTKETFLKNYFSEGPRVHRTSPKN